jgi:hypothetical protein
MSRFRYDVSERLLGMDRRGQALRLWVWSVDLVESRGTRELEDWGY